MSLRTPVTIQGVGTIAHFCDNCEAPLRWLKYLGRDGEYCSNTCLEAKEIKENKVAKKVKKQSKTVSVGPADEQQQTATAVEVDPTAPEDAEDAFEDEGEQEEVAVKKTKKAPAKKAPAKKAATNGKSSKSSKATAAASKAAKVSADVTAAVDKIRVDEHRATLALLVDGLPHKLTDVQKIALKHDKPANHCLYYLGDYGRRTGLFSIVLDALNDPRESSQ